jgi:hypothetical protein
MYWYIVVLTILSALSSATALHDSTEHPHHSHGNLESEYRFKLVLRDDKQGTYILHWKFDLKAEMISFAVNVSTQGWVGFGLSPNGRMSGSDVVIGWVKEDHVHFRVSEAGLGLEWPVRRYTHLG